jgi:hypothetical protein
VRDVPEVLRKQLIETTASANSGTIVIADRAGKEQLTQVLARRDSMRERNRPLAPGIPPGFEEHQIDPAIPNDDRSWRGLPWVAWAGFGIVLAAAAGIAAFFGLRW